MTQQIALLRSMPDEMSPLRSGNERDFAAPGRYLLTQMPLPRLRQKR
jgi:hypothetical protein